MSFKDIFPVVGCRTKITLKGALQAAIVGVNVTMQFSSAVESHVTGVATVWFETSVHILVVAQVVAFNERCRALVTLEWPLSSVDPEVSG